MHERDEVRTGSGALYRVFSPYFKTWSKLPKPPVGSKVTRLHTPPTIYSEDLPGLSHWKLKSEGTHIIEPGESAARARMRAFLSPEGRAAGYADRRGTPAGQTTSRLSQDLRWGLLSIRELHRGCLDAIEADPRTFKDGLDKFVSELAWRDFYFQVLYHYPARPRRRLQPRHARPALAQGPSAPGGI